MLTFVSSYKQAQAQKAEGRFAAQMNVENARIAEIQAADAIARGRVAESEKRLEIRGLIGEQRAVMAAQGIEINDPDSSAGHVQLSSTAQGEIDALTIRNNAAREAWGYKVQAADYMRQAQLSEQAGRNRATTTILTGAAEGLGIYSRYRGGLSVPKYGE
jgi:hypothetical protein